MRRLAVFNHVSLDGYFVDADGQMNWAKANHDDPEWNEFVTGNAGGESEFVFGRVTYELMSSFWPTPTATATMPEVAEKMNSTPKHVASRTLDDLAWSNSTLMKGDLADEVRKLKEQPGAGLLIMGSGTIVAQLAPEGLIDEYQVVVNPIVLGKGRTMFEGVPGNLGMKLAESRTFKNGNVFLRYERS